MPNGFVAMGALVGESGFQCGHAIRKGAEPEKEIRSCLLDVYLWVALQEEGILRQLVIR